MARVETFQDREESVVSPALVPLSLQVIFIAGLLQWLLPIEIMSDIEFIEDVDPDWLAVVGLFIALAGLSLSLAGRWAMTRRGAYVNTSLSATVLVTDGVFERTRNPGYVGMLIALFGIALAFAFDWLLILIVPVWILLHFVVVRHEEFCLQQQFGRAYQDYMDRVPRYFFIH
jgi:protein-S-isoprenylcysteine O-methyltransferase Ste14